MTNVIWAMQPPNVGSPSGEIKSFNQNFAFQTAFFIGKKKIKSLKPTQEKICVSKQCQLTISAPWQVTMLLSLTEPSACLL